MASQQVHLNCAVTLKSDAGKIMTYQLVDHTQVVPLSFKISSKSPLGKELLNKETNSKVQVSTPRGDMSFEIIKVEKAS